MDVRLDTPFESWGRFSRDTQDSPLIHGLLRYAPDKGVTLDLVENPTPIAESLQDPAPPLGTIYGQLVDGEYVTLSGCFIKRQLLQFGFGLGSPTSVVANRALFGCHVADLDQLSVKSYSVELSSIANWTGASPAECEQQRNDGKLTGWKAAHRLPAPIHVELQRIGFDLTIAHGLTSRSEDCTLSIAWPAYLRIASHAPITLGEFSKFAWRCENLMSLLIGHKLSVKAISISPAEAASERATTGPLHLLGHQRGKHDHPDADAHEMLLPYALIKDEFAQIVERWFTREEQAVLATDIYFGSQYSESPDVESRFLAIMQAAESYHRSLGTGVYMSDAAYQQALAQLLAHIPSAIEGDHKQSLVNRLKYGNEHSLRKRLTDLLNRLPESVRAEIAPNVSKFVGKGVDTRNYYTHCDRASQANAFQGKTAIVSAERVRILVVANLLYDLGIQDDRLLSVLRRSREFKHWMSEALPL